MFNKCMAKSNIGMLRFCQKIIGIIGMQRQRASCWHNIANRSEKRIARKKISENKSKTD